MTLSLVDYARRSWSLLQRLPAEHREQELAIMLRYLAEAGEPLSAVPTTPDEIRGVMVHSRLTLADPTQYWDYAQQSSAIEEIWIWLGQMEAALILRGVDRSGIGVTDAMISDLIRKLRKP